jgi:hypothetical protein
MANAITLGASHVQAFLGVGGPYRTDTNKDGAITAADTANPDAIGMVIDDFTFGLGLFQDKLTGAKYTALKATANKIGFTGLGDAFAFDMKDVVVAINTSSNPLLVLDLTKTYDGFLLKDSPGFTIPTGGTPVVLDFSNQLIQATVGHATAKVAGFVSLEGGFTFQKRVIDKVGFRGLGMNLEMAADALIVAGQNVQAFAGFNGPYKTDSNNDGVYETNNNAIGITVADLDFALALVGPSLGGARLPLNFFGLTAKASLAGLVGTDPYLTLDTRDVVFEFNGALAMGVPIPSVYADFSVINGGRGLDIPIGSNPTALNMSFNSNFLRVGMQANLGVFDLFTLNLPRFDFTFELPPIDFGVSINLSNIGLPGFQMPAMPAFDPNMFLPSISLQGLLGAVPNLLPSTPDWLVNGLKFLKDIDIRIGLAGVMGSISLPDLSMNIGGFVHLNGDFKLTLGQSFKADMATGLDPLLGLAADAAINAAAGALIPGVTADGALKYLLNVSSDYSVARDVTFRGLTFGASNVNMFVGAGSPDFDKPFSEQGGLVGFGLQNLSVAIANFKAILPQFMNAQSVFSFSAHANEMGVYGMGDILKILGKNITVDVNTGGKALGGVMRAMPVYSSIKNAGAPDGLKIATGGAPVYLGLGGTEILGLDVGLAEIAVADFLHLRGSLAFRKGEQFDVAVDLGGLAPIANQLGKTLNTTLNP